MGADEGFGIIPEGMYDDLEELPLDLLAVFSWCMAAANDHGLFEGRPTALARRFARPMEEIVPRLRELEARRLIAFYDAPKLEGGTTRVGEIVRFLGYRGQPQTRVQASRRRQSVFPLRDGSFPTHRGHSGDDEPASKKARTQCGTSAESPRGARSPRRNSRGASAESARSDGAALARAPEAQEQAQDSLALQGEREWPEPAAAVPGEGTACGNLSSETDAEKRKRWGRERELQRLRSMGQA